MYNFRLWVELSETTEEADCGQLDEKTRELQEIIDERLTMTRVPMRCIFQVNYTTILQCSGGRNRPGSAHDALMSVLIHITKVLPGSQGLVYWSDDEGSYGNVYRVIVIDNGRLHEHPDPFLSPFS